MGLLGQREVSGELKGLGVLRDSVLRMNWLDQKKKGGRGVIFKNNMAFFPWKF